MIVIRGASVLTGSGLTKTDVAIDNGVVSRIGSVSPAASDDVVTADGCVLGPGLVDVHVHLREPGQTWKEDIASGTEAAAAGGFTAVVAMPNTEPAIDSAKVTRQVQESAARSARVEVAVAGALTRTRSGLEMADIDGMYRAGVRIFTDDGDSVADPGVLRRLMRYLSDFPDAVIAQHAEDQSIGAGGHLHEGRVSRRLGVVGLPATAETAVIARDLELVAETGCRYHAQHISTARSAELIEQAKSRGLPVTSEVTPHHLTLTDDECSGLDPNAKMYPPLRTRDDVDALREALKDGVIDMIATDHAPHAPDEKGVPFEVAPRGIIGLETAFPLGLETLDGDIELLFQRMAIAPAKLAGLSRHGVIPAPGSPANLVLVDPNARWTVGAFRSKSTNSPFVGREMTGRVVATIHEGEFVSGGTQ